MDQKKLFQIAEDVLQDPNMSTSAGMAIAGIMRLLLEESVRPEVTEDEFEFLCRMVVARGTLLQFKGFESKELLVHHAEVFTTINGLYEVHGCAFDWLVAHFDDLQPWFTRNWKNQDLIVTTRKRWELVRRIKDTFSGGAMLVPENWYSDLENTYCMAMMAIMGEERFEQLRVDTNEGIVMLAKVKSLSKLTTPPAQA